MDRNYDEVISEMLIQLDQIDRRMKKADQRMEKFDRRLDLTIKRMVKAEQRLELSDKKHELSNKKHEQAMQQIMQQMELFNEKLEGSIKEQRENYRIQRKADVYFLNRLEQQDKLLEKITTKNNLKV